MRKGGLEDETTQEQETRLGQFGILRVVINYDRTDVEARKFIKTAAQKYEEMGKPFPLKVIPGGSNPWKSEKWNAVGRKRNLKQPNKTTSRVLSH